MAWENTLLASRILPPSYSPVDLVNNNRTQESTLSLEGGYALLHFPFSENPVNPLPTMTFY